MNRNMSTGERLLRGLIGAVLLGFYGALEAPWRYLTLIGLIPLGTALTGYCPSYRFFTPPWRRGKRDGNSSPTL